MINAMKNTKKQLVQIVDSFEEENSRLRDQLEAMQIVNSKIAEKELRLHQVSCDLQEAIVENNRQKAEMFEALFTS